MKAKLNTTALTAASAVLATADPSITPAVLREAIAAYKPEVEPAPKPERLLTRRETAEHLRLSLQTVNRMLRAGTLPRIHVSPRLVRIPFSALQALTGTRTAANAESTATANAGNATANAAAINE